MTAHGYAVQQVGINGTLVDPDLPTPVEFADKVAFGTQNGTAADAILFFQDVTGYGSLDVEVRQVTGTSLRVETSFDGVNDWRDAPGYAMDQVSNPGASAVLTSTIKYRIPVAGRWMRIRQIGAGSTQVRVVGSMIQSPPAAIQGGCMFYTESVALLSPSGVFNGSTRNNQGSTGASGTAGTRYRSFLAEVFTDQAGTLFIDKSTDGATWRQVASVAISAVVGGSSVSVETKISAQYYRVRFVNGATTQTIMLLTSAYHT
jgi:hypothetical protein